MLAKGELFGNLLDARRSVLGRERSRTGFDLHAFSQAGLGGVGSKGLCSALGLRFGRLQRVHLGRCTRTR
ncbi:MAG: hypothetical protein R3E96_08515 [Planctomycetota bacterium]